jgi:ribosomal protein S18 acetylase RimI-like enzyme
MPHQRHKMKLRLAEQTFSKTWPCRAISPADAPALGQLLVEAYRGTVDYEGETVEQATEEVIGMLGSKYGDFMTSSSFLVEVERQPVAACLITFWQEAPLVTVLMTHPSYKGQGLGTFLMRQSINALQAQGYQDLCLFVTVGNDDAQHIYEKLGFVVVDKVGG